MKRVGLLLLLLATPAQAVEWCKVNQELYAVALPSTAFSFVAQGGGNIHAKFDEVSCDFSQVPESYVEGAETHSLFVEIMLDSLQGLDGVPPPSSGVETYITGGGLDAAVTVIAASRGSLVVSSTVFPDGVVVSGLCSGPAEQEETARKAAMSVDSPTFEGVMPCAP